MYCLKCGREIEGQQVYCSGCLEIMDRYPIKPGTPVHLPKKDAIQAPKKQTRRSGPTPEEQIRRLKRIIKSQIFLFLIMCLALGFFVYHYFQPDQVEKEPSPGQSWSVASDET